MNARALLEDDSTPEFREERRPVTPEKAAYLDRVCSHPEGDVDMTTGNARYVRTEGRWYRVRRIRNPDYREKPSYFIIFGTMGGAWTMIFCKLERPSIPQVKFQRAIKAIVRDHCRGPVPWTDIQVDGVEEPQYARRASGQAPEAAYVIHADGTFVREKEQLTR